MAVTFAKECQFPQDLDTAFRDLEEELADRLIANEALLDAAVADIDTFGLDARIDEITNILEDLLKLGDGTSGIRTLDDLSNTVGLPKDPGRSDATSAEMAARETEEQIRDEQFLYDAGFILIDGVLYEAGDTDATTDNIDRLRDLYEALNKDLDQTADFLANVQTDPILVQSKLILERVPAKEPKKTAFTRDELRVKLNLPGLQTEDIVVNDDFSTVVLRKEFLGTNFSKDRIKSQFGVSEQDIVTEVFHINEKKSTPRLISKISRLGYTGEEINIMFRVGATELPIASIVQRLTTEQAKAAAIIDQIDFFRNRLLTATRQVGAPQVSSIAKTANQQRLNQAIIDLQTDHRQTISSTLFKVAILKDVNTLSSLREKHSDQQIVQLLERRPEIEGLKFNSTTADTFANMRSGLAATQPGSRLTSAAAMRRLLPRVTIDQQVLLFMWSDLIQAQDDVVENPLTEELLSHLQNARNHLTTFISRNPIGPEIQVDDPARPFDTQEVLTNPGAILSGRMDFSRTFSIPDVVVDLRNKADPNNSAFTLDLSFLDINLEAIVGRAIAAVINAVADLFEQAIAGCSRLLNKANNKLLVFKKRVDAMLSQMFSLVGSGSFDTSMLKCAVSFDIGLSGGTILPLLSNLLCVLASLLGGFLAKFSDWVADLINKVLCLPLGLINSLLGVVESVLPAGCQVPPIELGATITEALLNLKNIGDSKNVMISTMGKDLVKLRMFVNAAPEKVSQFSGGADCAGNVNRAYNAAILNISGGVALS